MFKRIMLSLLAVLCFSQLLFSQDKETDLIRQSKEIALLNNTPLGEYSILCKEDLFYNSFKTDLDIHQFGKWITENQQDKTDQKLSYNDQFDVVIFSKEKIASMQFDDDKIPVIFNTEKQ